MYLCLSSFSSQLPLHPVGPWLQPHPTPEADQLQLSPFSAHTVVLHTGGGISGDGPRGSEQTPPVNLGPEVISSSLLHITLVLTSQTLREAVKLQFPWLVFIFLLIKSAVTPGRATLPLQGLGKPRCCQHALGGQCPRSALKASRFTLPRHKMKTILGGREVKSHPADR